MTFDFFILGVQSCLNHRNEQILWNHSQLHGLTLPRYRVHKKSRKTKKNKTKTGVAERRKNKNGKYGIGNKDKTSGTCPKKGQKWLRDKQQKNRNS